MDQLVAVEKWPCLEGRTNKIRRRRKLRKEEEGGEEKKRGEESTKVQSSKLAESEFLATGPSESAMETCLRKSINL